MCSRASSSESTTRTASLSARNSVSYCVRVARLSAGVVQQLGCSPCRRTAPRPRCLSSSTTCGRKAAATSRWTSSVSAALHTPGRWHLGVDDDAQRLLEVGRGVDVDVTVAPGGGDHRDLALVVQVVLELLSRRAASRGRRCRAARTSSSSSRRSVAEIGYRLLRQARLDDGPLDDLGQDAVGVLRRAAAAQDDGVARLEARARPRRRSRWDAPRRRRRRRRSGRAPCAAASPFASRQPSTTCPRGRAARRRPARW